MTRARRNIYDGYCPICGKSGCDGSCIWPIPRMAAGPIPVPEGLAERVYQAVCEFIHTYWGKASDPLGDRSTRIVLTTKGTKVHGHPVSVIHVTPTSEKVLRPHGPLLGAFTYLDRSVPEIVLQFNGSKTGVEIDEAMRGLPGFRVQGWIHHELAHVFDRIPKGVGSDPWEDSKAYYNDPVEVRAYASQVWRYVMDNRDYYAASESWIQKTGEKGLWELVDSAVTGYVGAKIRNLCTEKNRRYILQTAYHALQEAMRPSKVAADEGSLKADLMRVRPILRAWTAGGWTDGPQLLKLLEKHKDILAKFRPTSPLRLWRNERIEGPDGGPGSGALNNHGWEDQYTRPTAWSARRSDAETYAAGKGRRLVTAIVPPEDMYVSVPMVDYAAKGLGMKSFDPYAQSEVIVRPNPSFLDQLRPPVAYTREEEAKIREQLVEQLRVYYAPQVKKLQEQHPEGAQGIAQRAEEQIQGMVSSIHTEELPEKVKEWTATIQQWEKTASVVLRASKTLYHGTTRDKAQEILKYGLAPDVGSLTTQAYEDEDADLQPLTFAADREGIGGGVFSAMLHAISAEGHPVTDEIQAIRNWGAVVVIKEGEDVYQHRPGLDEKGSEDDYVDYPTQVESGDYYSEDSVDADYAITGPALVRWLTRNGVNLHQGYADPITRSERNRLIGWVHRVHPNIPMQEIVEKVTSLPSREFRESWIYYKKALSKAASMPTITTQEAHDRGMFGPVFHGTTEDIFSKIQDEGFKLIEGQQGDEGVSNGYASGNYSNGIPPPAHHLGFGIYFTTVKSIAKYFAGGSTKTLKPYYLDVHNVETINFGSPNTMMKWWIANGYDPELAKKDRMAATKQLTETLRSKHDAVWFKGKGLHALLDKDQIVVFDPSKVYVLDDSKAEPGSLQSKVQRKSDGMVGVLLDKRPIPEGMYDKMMAARETLPEDQRNSHWFILTPETKYTLTVKWQKGGTDHNVYDTEVVPYQGKQTRAAALLSDIPAAPGTTPIKPGYVRLYHQTGEANLQSIERTGLRLDHAKGIEGPRGIYAGEEPFYGDPENIPTLEFQVPKDKWQPPFVLQDVMPKEFIAAHYPWHRTVRYLEQEPESMQAALAGQHDGLGGDEGKAIAYVKQKYGKGLPIMASVPKAENLSAALRGEFEVFNHVNDLDSEALLRRFYGGIELADFRRRNAGTTEDDRATDWLHRHNVPVIDGKVTFYHATPADVALVIEKEGLRAGSLLEQSPERAVFFARRDRDLEPKGIVCFAVTVPPQVLRYGMWPSTRGIVPPADLKRVMFDTKTASSFTLRQTPSREDSQNLSQIVKSSASKQPDSVYFHGRSQDRPYRGHYIFLTPSRDYALGYSKGPDGMHAFKIKVPMSNIFTMKHPEKLRAALSPEAWGSIEAAIQPGEEMDWASISSVCNEEHEEAEDLFQALGYKGTWLKERNGINSIYLFDQGDAEEVPLPTKTAALFQRQSGRSIMHGWLLPDGTFKDAAEGRLGEHWETALQEFSPDVQRPAKDPDIMGAMRKAFDAGWIRVSMQGLDALKWTDDMLHRAQAFLQQQGVLPRLRYFYVESQMPMWTAKVEPATDLLTLNKVSDLWRYRGSKTAAGTPTLRVSNPGGDWLKENQEACREGGKDRFGCPKVWGPVTASFSSDVLVQVDILKGIRGMRGEQNNVRPDTISWMTENMGQSGRLPQVNDQDYTPFIMVDCEGHPWVSEGNHRIMTAAKLGWKWLPIELRYFSGGEQARFGLLNPRFVINQHHEAERLGYNMDNYALKDPLDVKNQKPVVGAVFTEPTKDYTAGDHVKYSYQVPIGMNINDSQAPWTQMILQGQKTIETRDSDSLRPHVGEHVGIVRTGQGPAMLVGYCTLGEPKVYQTDEAWQADAQHHRVGGPLAPGAVKYGYPLSNVEPVDPPQPVTSQGRVFRKLASPCLFQKRADAPPVTELQKSPAQQVEEAAKAHPLQAPGRSDPTQTPEFQAWFRGSKAVNRVGRPLVVYHGSTHTFDKFDPSKGDADGFYGKGLYFTDSKVDVNSNYATDQGRDLQSRIDNRADELLNDVDDNNSALSRDAAYAKARQEIMGQSTGMVYMTYLRILKPVVVQPQGGTWFEGTRIDPKDEDNIIDSPQFNKIYEATLQASDELGVRGERVWEEATQNMEAFDGFTAFQFEQGIRQGDECMDVTGGPGPLIARIWQLMGFDGIIMDAEGIFKGRGMDMSPGTKHYIVWNPRQVKSAIGNFGAFNPRSKRLVAEDLLGLLQKKAST